MPWQASASDGQTPLARGIRSDPNIHPITTCNVDLHENISFCTLLDLQYVLRSFLARLTHSIVARRYICMYYVYKQNETPFILINVDDQDV